MSSPVRWVRCKGCGLPLVLFLQEIDGQPKGSVGHARGPGALRVSCALYHRLTSEELTALHRDAEEMAPPDSFHRVAD